MLVNVRFLCPYFCNVFTQGLTDASNNATTETFQDLNSSPEEFIHDISSMVVAQFYIDNQVVKLTNSVETLICFNHLSEN